MSSVVGLELPNAWRTGQSTDPSFDISADQLNVTANRELWIPGSTIDWAAVLHKNSLDPVDAQDLATKIYVDTNSGQNWSTFPALQNVDYVNLYKNINLIEPINPQDSATKNYVDLNVGSQTLGGLTDVTLTNEQSNDVIQFNGTIWVNQPISVPAGSIIEQGNSSVSVIDTGIGRVETVIDNVKKFSVEQDIIDVFNPIQMNTQAIRSVQNPTNPQDAATKDYVDTEIAALPIKTDLDSLTDVTITTPLVDQILVNNGSGQWVNQVLGKSQLPTEIAYEDEVNTFTQNNVFQAGLTLALDQNLDMADGFISDTKYVEWSELASDPSDPTLDETRMFLDSGADFGSTDPLLNVLIDRGGTIQKKPIPTSETIFALKDFTNGMFIDETGTRLVDNNPSIRVQVFQEANEATGTIRAVLGGNIFTIPSPDVSVTVANTIDLGAGTATAPVTHYVWLELQLGVPTLNTNTTGFPTTGDFVLVGQFLFQALAEVISDGPYAVNAPDNEIFDDASRGHLAHINDRILRQDALYISGITLTTSPLVGAGTLTAVTYTSTAGLCMELHNEDIESFDISTGIALVSNDAAQQPLEFTKVVNLSADLLGMTCANGADIMYGANNDTANIVIFTIHVDSEPNQTNYGINLPFQQYQNDDASAIADVDNFAIRNVPLNARGIALLVAEVVIKFTTGGNYEVLAVKDLRGQIPGAAGGSGGGGGGGATQLNDLSDVTINTALVDQILQNDGAGQWINVDNPAGLLADPNTWLGYQDYNNISEPVAPAIGVGRFFVETIDASNDGLFIWLRTAGGPEKKRIA